MPWKARLLTSGLKPSSRLPPLEGRVTQWEVVAGYSGATASDSHGLPLAFHRICYRPVSRDAPSARLMAAQQNKKAFKPPQKGIEGSLTKSRKRQHPLPRKVVQLSRKARLLAYGIQSTPASSRPNAGKARNPHPGPLPAGEGETTCFLPCLLSRTALKDSDFSGFVADYSGATASDSHRLPFAFPLFQ